MTEIISERGASKGRISIPRTIDTMAVGEIWNLNSPDYSIENVRTCCSTKKLDKEKVYKVFGPNARLPFITIQRIK